MKATNIEYSKDGLIINGEKYGYGIESLEIVSPNDIRITVDSNWKDDNRYLKIMPKDMKCPSALERFENIRINENKYNYENLGKIIEHYGLMTQLKYFQTEIFELNEAIITAEEHYDPDIDHIAEEIADVLVMLRQFQFHFLIEDLQIKDIMKNKIERQLKRIEEEKKNG